MKKTLLSLILLLTTMGATTAQAFDFDWGLTGGLNVTKLNMKGTNAKFFDSTNRAGWFVGPKIDMGFVLGFGLDAAVLYQQAQHNIKFVGLTGQTYSSTHTTDYVSLPINARYNIGLGDALSLYIATGPQFDFMWDGGEENWFDNIPSTFRQENLTVNWNVGCGLRIVKHVEVGLAYNFGLSKAGERVDNWGSAIMNGLQNLTGKDDYRANAFKLHVSYYF